MPVFPPAPAIRVSIDGRRVAQYARPFVWRGRVYASGALFRLLADRVWRDGGVLVVQCAGRSTRARTAFGTVRDPDAAFFAIAPVLRALGDDVVYNVSQRTLYIGRRHAAAVATPTPFAAPPEALPVRTVFTPEPVPTPRPVWTGSPLPRRTPLPFPPVRRSRA